MALITRLSRLFQADLHAVLDRIEEPDTLLRQAIREMQEALDSDEQQIKRLQQSQAQLSGQQSDLDRSLISIEEELDICFEAGEDALAYKLIRRKLEAERFSSFLSRKRQSTEQDLKGLSTRQQEHRASLEHLQKQAELLTEADSIAPPGESMTTPDFSVREEDVEVAFLREQQRRSGS